LKNIATLDQPDLAFFKKDWYFLENPIFYTLVLNFNLVTIKAGENFSWVRTVDTD